MHHKVNKNKSDKTDAVNTNVNKTIVNKSRRTFLKTTALGTSSLVLGIYVTGCDSSGDVKTLINNEWVSGSSNAADAGSEFFPNAFIRITSDNTVNFYIASSEMGQGVMTSLAMLLAEELEVSFNQVTAEFAPVHPAYENPSSGKQRTGGSSSIRGFYQPLREAGAVARQLLIEAAAKKWNVAPTDCYAENGVVIHRTDKQQIPYGELIEIANGLPVPETATLKETKDFKLIGKAISRNDFLSKVNGSAKFGLDVTLEGLHVASVVRPPLFGAKVLSVDSDQAKKVNGVVDIFEISAGVAIVATHYWATKQARDVLTIKWDSKTSENISDDSIRQQFINAIDEDAKMVEDIGDVEQQIASAPKKLQAVYETPYLAHACMEPMNCTAYVQQDRCDIWVPTQSQENTQKTGAKITGLSRSKVFVHTTFLGGGFGRRGEQDFVTDAVEISQRMQKPVKVSWSREDDIKNDFYRPATYNQLAAAISDNGELLAWQHKIAGPAILERFIPFARLVLWGKDKTSLSGAEELPYSIPNFRCTYAWVDTGIPVGFWRSVGHSQNGFVTECFIDEAAHAAGKDPYQFRRSLITNKPRLLNVLDQVATQAAWGKDLPQGHYQGMALVESFGSIVAQVAEVSIQGKEVRVHKVTAVADCGVVVNPDTVKAQIEGGIVYGLTAALYGEINISKGGVQQSNFHDYQMLRIDKMPLVNVHLVESNNDPGGVGEIGVPPIAPAVANAVFAATGQPVRKLPIKV